ncbi:MAG: hypothetical protein QF664_10340 [Dehalococcoidia bacterium]|nr:hypothetical protein [Dehalococcoidia bacterium]
MAWPPPRLLDGFEPLPDSFGRVVGAMLDATHAGGSLGWTLVGQLSARVPENRPASAAEVGRTIERIIDSLSDDPIPTVAAAPATATDVRVDAEIGG